MYVNLNKYVFYSLKFISFLSFIAYFYGSYRISSGSNPESLSILLLLLLYCFGYLFYLIFVSLHKKLDYLYPINVRYTPIFPVLFYSYYLLHLGKINETMFNYAYVIKILVLYFGLTVFNKFYTNLISDKVTQFVIGKDTPELTLADDFSYISIVSQNYPEYGDQFELIKNIIVNLLGYKKVESKHLKDKYVCGRIYKFTRIKYEYSRRCKENILLLPLDCTNVNYLNWLNDPKASEKTPIAIKLDYLKDGIRYNVPTHVSDSDISSNLSYQCHFILQYTETEDEIEYLESFSKGTYLTFANVLSKHDIFTHFNDHDTNNSREKAKEMRLILRKSLVIFHKDNNLFADNIWGFLNNIFSKFMLADYGTLTDKLIMHYQDKVEKEILEIIARIKNYADKYKNTINFIALIISIFSLLGGIIKACLWFKNKYL